MIVLQCEVLTETLEYVLELAAQWQRPVLLNLAPARKVSEAGLRNVAYLVVNESEAESTTSARFRLRSCPRMCWVFVALGLSATSGSRFNHGWVTSPTPKGLWSHAMAPCPWCGNAHRTVALSLRSACRKGQRPSFPCRALPQRPS